MRLRVRAYNVGSGDCILISWDEADRMHHAWVDFGTHPFDKQAPASGTRPSWLTSRHDRRAHRPPRGHPSPPRPFGGFYSMRQEFKDSFQVDRVWHAWVDRRSIPSSRSRQPRSRRWPARLRPGDGGDRRHLPEQHRGLGADAMNTVAAFAPAGGAFKVHRLSNLAAATPPGWARMQIDILGPEQDSGRYLVPMDTSLRARTALNAEFDGWAGAEVTEALADAVAAADGEGAGDPAEVPDFLKLADFARLRRLLQGGRRRPAAGHRQDPQQHLDRHPLALEGRHAAPARRRAAPELEDHA